MLTLGQKCPYLELFWSLFSHIRTEYGQIRTRATPNMDTFQLDRLIVLIEHDEIMISFDVTFLYTNIAIIDTLNIIKNYVTNDDSFTRKTVISQDKFLDLVNLVTCYTFNSRSYQQTEGAAMG